MTRIQSHWNPWDLLQSKYSKVWAERLETFSAYLHNGCPNTSIEPNPVYGRNDSVAGHRAEDNRAQPVPLLSEVTGVDLGKEYCQNHSKHSDQVDLTPVLEGLEEEEKRKEEKRSLSSLQLSNTRHDLLCNW